MVAICFLIIWKYQALNSQPYFSNFGVTLHLHVVLYKNPLNSVIKGETARRPEKGRLRHFEAKRANLHCYGVNFEQGDHGWVG